MKDVYDRLRYARETSKSPIEFVKKAIAIVCGTLIWLIFIGFTMAIPIASIIIGAMYLDDCPLERYIPIYLVVSGAFGLFYLLYKIVKLTCCKEEDKYGVAYKLRKYLLSYPTRCFLVAWFIAGNVWVYGSHSDLSTNPASANYCHPTAYYFAFWVITSTYILTVLIVIILLSACCMVFCCLSKEEEN